LNRPGLGLNSFKPKGGRRKQSFWDHDAVSEGVLVARQKRRWEEIKTGLF